MMNVLLYLAVGAGIGAAIGNTKGRVGAGAALGALLGPIGWLLVALGPNNGPKCAACQGPIPAGATACMHCGARF